MYEANALFFKKTVGKTKHLCYHKVEVKPMDEKQQQEQQEVFTPRPKWQLWGARFLLVLFIVLLIMYYTNLFRGGA